MSRSCLSPWQSLRRPLTITGMMNMFVFVLRKSVLEKTRKNLSWSRNMFDVLSGLRFATSVGSLAIGSAPPWHTFSS
ncbi:hypothetical protein XENTR_v10022926 [Xenopus tropicalis]|nr:hypothetical protein XENTR_v10022926 [Xenopus tropicalis]